MLRSLFSGVSGLNASQEMLDTIGNNIANVSTTGYKGSNIQFEDLLSQTSQGAQAPANGLGGINPTQVGLGVKVAGVQTDFTQGTSEQTGRALDLSVQGDGFFVANGGSQSYYTRAGSLNLDANGDLVTPDGLMIQGWGASAGMISTNGPLQTLTIPTGKTLNATATAAVTLSGNLSSTIPSGSTTPSPDSTSVTVYDSLGAPQQLNVTFTPTTVPSGAPSTATSAWSISGALGSPASGSGSATVAFDANGDLVYVNPPPTGGSSTGNQVVVQASTSGGGTQPYTLDLQNFTNNASSSSLTAIKQDGYPSGTLESYSITTDGVIQGTFTNGLSQALGQIAIANFANPGGLERSGDTNFISTANSGLAQVGAANSGGRGSISPGTLEASNVDLGQEFTNLIMAQQAYAANGKVITTSNTVLQDTINLVQ